MLLFSFWISLLSALILPVLLPSIHLLYFLPYLVVCCYRRGHLNAVKHAILVGVFMDLLSHNFCFGIHILTMSSTLLICYPLKGVFFEDKISTLPLLTFVFSLTYTPINYLYLLFLSYPLPLNMRWVVTDLFEMAICDALFALVLFVIPFQLTRQILKLRLYVIRRKASR